MAAESIILDGQALTGTDHFGEWSTTSLDGWWSSPEPKSEDVSRENADGDFDLPVDYEARYVTITGSLQAKNHEMQHAAINRFTALVRQRARLQVIGHGAAQWIDVKRASGFKMEPVTDTYAQWQARVKAPIPSKYGERQRFTIPSGTTVAVFHRGNYDAWPAFTVTGNMPEGYWLYVGGKGFRVTRPLTSGSHAIDYRDGRLRVNGSFVAGGLSSAALAPITPGASTQVRLDAVSGTGSAALTVYDTYI